MSVKVEFRELTHFEYHSEQEYDSSTALKEFRKRPMLYYHQRITKRVPGMKETPSIRLGSVVHTATLEPNKFDSLVKVIPAEVLTSDGAKRGKKWEVFEWDNRDSILLKQQEYDDVRWSVESIRENKLANRLIEECTEFEKSCFLDNGVHKLKCRWDGVAEMDAHFVDIKRTSELPETWWRKVRDFQFHCQAAHYAGIFYAAYGKEPVVRWVIVQDTPPFECVVKRVPDVLLAEGARINAETLKAIRLCRETGVWEHPGASDDSYLQFPEYLVRDE